MSPRSALCPRVPATMTSAARSRAMSAIACAAPPTPTAVTTSSASMPSSRSRWTHARTCACTSCSSPWSGPDRALPAMSSSTWTAMSFAPPSLFARSRANGMAWSATFEPSVAQMMVRNMPVSPETGHDVLDDGVVLERVHGEVLAVAGLLEAAVRHLGGERDVVVDPHTAETQRLGDAQPAADVARPDRRGEAVLGAVGPGDRLILFGEALDGDDRPEDLALDQLVVLPEVRDDGRLEKEARKVGLAAAGDDLGVAGPPLQEALDALALALGVDRAERRVRRRSVAHDAALGLLGQTVDDVVVDLRARQHARGRGAVLPGVVVAGPRDRLHRGLHVDVVEDDDRRLAAELQVHPLERLRGVLGDPFARLHRPGEGHHVDVVVGHERGPGVVAAGDDVQHALRRHVGSE